MDNISKLINIYDHHELTLFSRELIGWEIGAFSSMNEVAKYMCKYGPNLSEVSIKTELEKRLFHKDIIQNKVNIFGDKDDPRPNEKYWHFVKQEFFEFLCLSSPKYEGLWERIGKVESKGTTAVVATLSAYFGDTIGVAAGILSGFVAVCLYAVAKLGKEAVCEYLKSK